MLLRVSSSSDRSPVRMASGDDSSVQWSRVKEVKPAPAVSGMHTCLITDLEGRALLNAIHDSCGAPQA